jgi:hypothetical protein
MVSLIVFAGIPKGAMAKRTRNIPAAIRKINKRFMISRSYHYNPSATMIDLHVLKAARCMKLVLNRLA